MRIYLKLPEVMKMDSIAIFEVSDTMALDELKRRVRDVVMRHENYWPGCTLGVGSPGINLFMQDVEICTDEDLHRYMVPEMFFTFSFAPVCRQEVFS